MLGGAGWETTLVEGLSHEFLGLTGLLRLVAVEGVVHLVGGEDTVVGGVVYDCYELKLTKFSIKLLRPMYNPRAHLNMPLRGTIREHPLAVGTLHSRVH